LHHAPIRIKVVRGFNPAGEKEQGQKDPKRFGAPSLLVRAGTPVRETGPRKSSLPAVGRGTRPCPNKAITGFMV